VTDKNLHELDELGDEEHEGEDEQAEESVADDFAGDVAIEEAHGAKGECNMGEKGSEEWRIVEEWKSSGVQASNS
jgi:hypothetical protein